MQMAKPDGMGPVACQSTGNPRAACSQDGQETPDPCKVRKETQGQFSTETPGWTRSL